MTDNAVKVLLQSLEQDFKDTGIVLDQFEATHNDYECNQSKPYSALVAGHFGSADFSGGRERVSRV